MTSVEAAWVGAMVEGEGCVGWSGHRFSVRVSNTEVETIATILRLVGDGRVQFYFKRPYQWKNCWCWDLAAKRSLSDLLPQIIPFLTSKQEKSQRLLAEVSHA